MRADGKKTIAIARLLAALILFVVAVALVFVRPGVPYASIKALAEPFDLAGFAARLAKDGKWVDAHDTLACALAHARDEERPAISGARNLVQTKLARAAALTYSQLVAMKGDALWEQVATMAPEAILSPQMVRGIGARAADAEGQIAEVLRISYGVALSSGSDPAPALLICLEQLHGFSESFSAALTRRLAGGSVGSTVSGSGGVERKLGETWKAIWSVCRSSQRLGRAASILRHVQGLQDLRLAVIACGLASDAPQKLNAILSVQGVGLGDNALGAECLYRVAYSRAGAVERLNELHECAYRGPHAVRLVARGVALADVRRAQQPGGLGLVTRIAARLTAWVGGFGFLVVKLLLVVGLSLPLGVQLSRFRQFSTRESKQMVKWSVVLLVIVAAIVAQAAGRPAWAEAADTGLAAATDAARPAAPAVAASRGWLWATPLTLLAVLVQALCIVKARERFGQIASARSGAQSAMRYLRFYTEAPVFIGFLGSVTGAILLQILAAGEMIYFAYLSTATGLLAFLWIQYRYVILAEGKLAGEQDTAASEDKEDAGRSETEQDGGKPEDEGDVA